MNEINKKLIETLIEVHNSFFIVGFDELKKIDDNNIEIKVAGKYAYKYESIDDVISYYDMAILRKLKSILLEIENHYNSEYLNRYYHPIYVYKKVLAVRDKLPHLDNKIDTLIVENISPKNLANLNIEINIENIENDALLNN